MTKEQASSQSEWRTALLTHAEYYSALAAVNVDVMMGLCPGKSQLRGLAQIAPELENVILALDTSLRLGLKSTEHLLRLLHLHFFFRGEFNAQYQQFEPLLQRARRSGDATAELECLLALAQAAQRTGRTRKFQALAEEALAIASQLMPNYRTVEAHYLIGMYWLLQHDFARARQHFQDMLEVATRVNDQLGMASASAGIGVLEKYEGNFEKARVALDMALERVGATENLHARAFILNDRASLEYAQGNYATARALFAESLSFMERCGSSFGCAHVLGCLGNVDCAEGNYAAAQATYERALEIQVDYGHMYEAGTLLLNLGNTALHLGEIDTSISRSSAALKLLRDAVEPHATATCLQNLGQAYGRRGDFELAADALRAALEEHSKLEDDESVILNCLAAGETLLLAGLFGPAHLIALTVAGQAAQRAMVLEADEQQLLEKLLRAADSEAGSECAEIRKGVTGMTISELATITLEALQTLPQRASA